MAAGAGGRTRAAPRAARRLSRRQSAPCDVRRPGALSRRDDQRTADHTQPELPAAARVSARGGVPVRPRGSLVAMLPPDAEDSMIGRTIGPYTIVEQIGHGAMGVVYRGIHHELKEQRAIKLLSPAAFASQAARQQLRSEARALARVQHPNVAILHDYITTPECDGIVMEMESGERLDDVVRQRGARSEAEAGNIAI